ncbi:unnamed protein product [Brachionus calyciflorus]|uniref:Uncharacterized protein n=1 Tax=Brachionus calyciflorus TaxID=104777 RepID=A0A813Y7V8_9BILA|nr:unnamed protein product [Brachionus calyciflorus]
MIAGFFERIKKGRFLRIVQSESIVAVSKKKDSILTDFLYFGQGLTKFNFSQNLRIYANVIIDTSYMSKIFEFSLKFDLAFNETLRKFNITTRFQNTNFESNRTFTISQNRYLEINCPNSNKTVNETIHCSVIGISQIKDDFLSIWFDGEEIRNFSMSDKLVSQFGFYDANDNITDTVSIDFRDEFVLPNTELRIDTNIIGFECYAVTAGAIKIFLLNMGIGCDKYSSCSEYFYQSSGFDSRLQLGDFYLNKGYNKFQFKRAYRGKKGQMLSFITTQPNLLGINVTENGMFSDFKGQGFYAKLDQKTSWRFYFNIIVDKFIYLNHFYLSKKFDSLKNDTFETSFLNAKIDQTDIKFSRIFNATIIQYPLFEDIALASANTRHSLNKNLIFFLTTSYFYDKINVNFGDSEFLEIDVSIKAQFTHVNTSNQILKRDN